MTSRDFEIKVGADRTITLPDELAEHLKSDDARCLLFSIDEKFGAVSVRPLLRSYAGLFASLYGTPDEAQAYIDAERASWEQGAERETGRTIAAVFENGVLRPQQPVTLEEGETVDLLVLPRPKRRPAEILAEIAALPSEGKNDGVQDVSENHDRYLYGERPA